MTWTRGLDLSAYQDNPNTYADDVRWGEVYSAGYRFAIFRVDCGASYVDPMFATLYDGARSFGLHVGAYHYARPMAGKGDAQAEFDHFYRLLDGRRPKVIALDIEESKIGGDRLASWLREWVSLGEQRGFTVCIYTSPAYLLGLGTILDASFLRHPLWIAHYGVTMPGTLSPWPLGGWTIWQTDAARVPGVAYPCDRNWFQGDEGACQDFFEGVPSTKRSLI